MVYECKDKVVVVTGGASGIGAAVVKAFIQDGVKHVAILDIAETQGIAFQNELNAQRGEPIVKFIKCDVANEDQLSSAFKAVADQCGYIDVVVNNAGVCNEGPEMIRRMIEINFTALVSSSLKALELMRMDKGGKGGAIVNVASIAAFLDFYAGPVYGGTKAAVMHFTSGLGLGELFSRSKVRTVTVCFGATDTDIIKKCCSFDEQYNKELPAFLASNYLQKVESAGRGLVDAYKLGESGSVWMVNGDKPAKDITEIRKKVMSLYAAEL